MKWMRMRFHANPGDYRAVKWPPLGPYWCSGQGGWDEDGTSFSIVVAFIPIGESIEEKDRFQAACSIVKEFWPEATEVETSGIQWRDAIEFYDRFPCPTWWDGEQNKYIGEYTEDETCQSEHTTMECAEP